MIRSTVDASWRAAKTPTRPGARDSGYSLVEISVVLAIIGIMASIGIPSFVRLMPRMKLSSNAAILSNEIASLRMQAIAKSTKFCIAFDVPTQRYHIERLSGTTWTRQSTSTISGTTLVNVVGFGNDPDYPIAYPAGTVLVARPAGGVNVPLSSQAIVVLQTPSGDMQKQLLVEPTGRVIAQKRLSDGNWTPD